ncbi:MAG: OmpA family protein [Okeania sp. SIO2D1]|nr:OmpA family protein [Okeania sp. SIO2D1]
MAQTVESSIQTSHQQKQKRPSWLKVLLIQFLILGISSSLAFTGGLIFALFKPQNQASQPLFAKIWDFLLLKDEIVLLESETSKVNQLDDTERKQLKTEVEGLQAQLNAIDNRIVQIEKDLETTGVGSDRRLEVRLKTLLEVLQTSQANPPVTQNSPDKTSSNSQLQVTLPSDVLFSGQTSNLTPEAPMILSEVVADLQKSPGNTIRISAYTDTNTQAEDNQELSFRHAQTIEKYLASQLDEQYRFVIMGYGQTSVDAQQSETTPQLTRRIEIEVD